MMREGDEVREKLEQAMKLMDEYKNDPPTNAEVKLARDVLVWVLGGDDPFATY